jgi:phenylacetic acid degradation operon negative regulatory protein
LIADLLAGERLRAAGFIVTVYGDVAEPRGGRLWMATLIEVCGLAGISETLIRTAVSRLVAAGRLEGARDGRRSYYRLTETAREEFAQAAARIFAPAQPPGRWLVTGAVDGEEEAMSAAGFQPLGGGLWLGVEQPGIAMPAGFTLRAELASGTEAFRDFAAERWRLAGLAAAYTAFCNRFAPLAAALAAGAVPDGETSLIARLLLVHHYRLALLDDPNLPPDALDPGWPGGRARALFADLYSRLSPAADAHIAQAFAATETEATRRRMLALAEA